MDNEVWYCIDGGVSRSILKDDAKYEFHDLNGTIDPQHQFPVSIESIGDCLNRQNVKWIRSLNSEFVERFLELSLFYGLSSPLNSEMICIFPYF